MLKFVLAMPLTFLFVAAAAADSVPNLDVTPSCRGAARAVVKSESEKREKACYDTEKAARDKLTQNWASFPDKDRNFCTTSIKSYAPTYTELTICLEMIRDVRQIGDKPESAPEKAAPKATRPARP
jgi:hypothetical protein